MEPQTEKIKAGNRVRELRGDVSQALMARKLGVSRQTLVNWENGKGSPDWSALRKIVKITGIDLHWLIMGAGDE